jgi:hypothetical protein
MSRQRYLQCPKSTLSPAMGATCGRREREASTGDERGVILSRARCCNGERHPDSPDAVNLRGSAEKRGSWSVRLDCVGLVPRQAVAPMTTGVLWKNEEGNVVSVRQAHALGTNHWFVSRTRPSLGPETRARQSALNSAGIRASVRRCEVSRRSRHRGRANLGNQEEPAPGSRSIGRMRGSPRVTALLSRLAFARDPQERSCVTRQKRKVVMAIVPARNRESRIFRPYVVRSCNKSAGSILASNKPVRSAPKRVAVRVNGGLGGAASGT